MTFTISFEKDEKKIFLQKVATSSQESGMQMTFPADFMWTFFSILRDRSMFCISGKACDRTIPSLLLSPFWSLKIEQDSSCREGKKIELATQIMKFWLYS